MLLTLLFTYSIFDDIDKILAVTDLVTGLLGCFDNIATFDATSPSVSPTLSHVSDTKLL